MRVLIAGAGNVGTYIAADLLAAGHQVVLVEQVEQLVGDLRPRPGLAAAAWVVGDACEVPTLADADAGAADVVVAATGDDEDNLVISLLAKQEFAVPRVLARVNHPENEWLFDEGWGVDVSVSTPHLLTALVEEAVSVGSLVRLLSLGGGRAGLVEVTLAESSPAVGRSLQDLDFPRGSTVVAIIRAGTVVVPRGDTTLHADDEVMVLVTDESEQDVKDLLIG